MQIEEWVNKRVRILDAGQRDMVVVFRKIPGAFDDPGKLNASGIFFSGEGMVGFAVEANDPVAAEASLRTALADMIKFYIKDSIGDYLPADSV